MKEEGKEGFSKKERKSVFMGLQHGGVDAQQQVNDSLSAEEQRKIKNGMILRQLRRYWRFACIALGILSFIYYAVSPTFHMSIVEAFVLNVITFGLLYLFVTYVFLYLLAYRVLQAFFYFRDLFGGNKETRL